MNQQKGAQSDKKINDPDDNDDASWGSDLCPTTVLLNSPPKCNFFKGCFFVFL